MRYFSTKLNWRQRQARLFVACFVLASIAIFAGLHVWIGRERWPQDPHFSARWRQMVQHAASDAASRSSSEAPYRVVFLGSSRTLNGIDIASFKTEINARSPQPVWAHNLGIPGSGSVSCLIWLHRLIESGVRPDAVVMEILPAACGQKPGGEWYGYQFVHMANFTEREKARVRTFGTLASDPEKPWFEPAWWTHRKNLVTQVYPKLWHLHPPGSLSQYTAEGQLPFDDAVITPEQRKKGFTAAREAYQELLGATTYPGESVRALDAIAELCKKENIALSLLVLPEGPELQSWYRPGGQAELRKALDDFSARHDAPWFDSWDALPEERFVDSHHPLASGAKLLAQKLAREQLGDWIVEMTWRRTPANRLAATQ